MVFMVLIPMLVGPAIGNAINKAMNVTISDTSGADTMTTMFVPAPEIFLAAGLCTAFILALIPLLSYLIRKKDK